MSSELTKVYGQIGGHRSGLPPGLVPRPSVFGPASLTFQPGRFMKEVYGSWVCTFWCLWPLWPFIRAAQIFFIVWAVREGCPFPLYSLLEDDSGRSCWCNSPAAPPRLGGGSAAEGCRPVPLLVAAGAEGGRWPRLHRWPGPGRLALVLMFARSSVPVLPFWASIWLIGSIF